ncbi:FtsX-like permease family protein [Catellatospora sp. NPDC049609]|uniref:FtsX-like permease family protein n=1 Tax=Catellatospora sp. NPDC049609 TaxID=3155505 RepID=UPI003426902C
MRPSLLLRLALAGTRTDRLRVVLTGLTAALAAAVLLTAATVLAIVPDDPDYQVLFFDDPTMRQAVAAMLTLLCLPVLALAAQAGRVGAPARHRRLAALRLAGATPGQVTAIAAAETGVAAGLGGLLGLALFRLAQGALHRRNGAGVLWLPTDVRPGPLGLLLVLAGLPVASALLAALLLRGLHGSPLGVAARATTPAAPRMWPLLLIGLGVAVFGYLATGTVYWPDGLVVGAVGAAAVAGGLVLGMAWLSDRAGRLLHRFGRGPAALLAAGRLRADPWTGSRTVGVLIVCAVLTGTVLGLREHLGTEMVAQRLSQGLAPGAPLPWDQSRDYLFSMVKLLSAGVGGAAALAAAGLLVALLEAVAARRRAFAALTATGVTRGVLTRALLWQALAPVAAVVPAAILLGAVLARLVLPEITVTTVTGCQPADCSDLVMRSPARTLTWLVDPVDYAAASLAGLALVALLAAAAAATLRGRTDLAALRTG